MPSAPNLWNGWPMDRVAIERSARLALFASDSSSTIAIAASARSNPPPSSSPRLGFSNFNPPQFSHICAFSNCNQRWFHPFTFFLICRVLLIDSSVISCSWNLSGGVDSVRSNAARFTVGYTWKDMEYCAFVRLIFKRR